MKAIVFTKEKDIISAMTENIGSRMVIFKSINGKLYYRILDNSNSPVKNCSITSVLKLVEKELLVKKGSQIFLNEKKTKL